MKLKVTLRDKHDDAVTGLGWTSQNELFSVADDKVVYQWDVNAEFKRKVCETSHYPTSFCWSPAHGSMNQNFVVGCSNGSFELVSKNGRTERKVPTAHKGAVLCCKFNHDGTALMTGGEDGFVKKWSKTGNLQSKLVQTGRAIYSLSWSPDSQSILFCTEKYLTIKPLSPAMKETKWKAHDGVVLTVDWNPISNLIISGGEDCKYKIWDNFGRQLFSSSATEFTITSMSWAPSGDVFAVGSFNRLMLCDKHGWAHSSDFIGTGSLYGLSWTADGTQVAGAGASGKLVFGQRVGKRVFWDKMQAETKDLRRVLVTDLTGDAKVSESAQVHSEMKGEDLEFSDRVVDISLGQSHLVVVTQKSCYIYKTKNFNTHHKVDCQGIISLVMQAKGVFLLVSNLKGLQLYNMDGQLKNSPRLPGVPFQFLKKGNISLSPDILAVINRNNRKEVLLIDTENGKQFSEPFRHSIDVIEIELSQTGMTSGRKLMFIDANRDLYITRLHNPQPIKLATMVESARWHSTVDVLACVSHQKLIVWYYPHVVYVDKDLLSNTRMTIDATNFGKQCELVAFHGSTCTIQKADGSLLTSAVSPFPITLVDYASKNNWPQCTRLCRFVKHPVLWACLAAVSIDRKQLETAAISFAAIDEVDKLESVQNVMSVPSLEGQRAELLLYQRRPDAAEQVLINAKLFYRAIKLNIRIFRWNRALELALKYRERSKISHVDTVLGYRQNHLDGFNRKETDPNFIQAFSKVKIDWNTIHNKEKQEDMLELKKGGRKDKDSVILKVILETNMASGSSPDAESSQTGEDIKEADEEHTEETKAEEEDAAFDQDDHLTM